MCKEQCAASQLNCGVCGGFCEVPEGHFRSALELVHSYKIIISSDPNSLRKENPDATVEAEYGDEVVEGRLRTLAHHVGPYKNEPPPCSILNCQELLPTGSSVGLSHIDLDTLGGILRLAQYQEPYAEGFQIERAFWLIAEDVDVQGAHYLGRILSSWQESEQMLKNRYNAWCAWAEKHRFFAPKDGSVADCTSYVREALTVLYFIMRGDKDYIEDGRKWEESRTAVNHESMKKRIITPSGKLFVRQHIQFTNIYYEWEGEIADLIIAHNLTSGAITLSRRDTTVKVDCCKIMQEVFGNKAGGHPGIAGSPRGVKYSSEEFQESILSIVKLLDNYNE